MATKYPEIDDVRAEALKTFAKEFGEDAAFCALAPGRVNLIGEHTDYNEGFVLPMALPMITVIVGKVSGSTKCKIISLSDAVGPSNTVEFELTSRGLLKPSKPNWANYIKGCIANFPCDVPAFNAVVLSTVPVGAGLSSSAALEVATFTFLEALTENMLTSTVDKALACQRAEIDFAGVPCGIMDQFISTMGQDGNALLLDCRDHSTKQIPMLHISEYVFLITNSNTPHKLSSSAYCERRDSCFAAAKELGTKSLREASIEDIKVLKTKNIPEVTIRRAKHVVTEIQRTLDAATALENDDFEKFGQLMNESHDSLRDDYEVSSKELDCLVSSARKVPGVLGSRLTGAGFGGCTVTLVRKEAVDDAIKTMKEEYTGSPTFYIAKPSSGAKIL